MKAASSSRATGKEGAAGWITITGGIATALGISIMTAVMTGIATTIGVDGASDPESPEPPRPAGATEDFSFRGHVSERL